MALHGHKRKGSRTGSMSSEPPGFQGDYSKDQRGSQQFDEPSGFQPPTMQDKSASQMPQSRETSTESAPGFPMYSVPADGGHRQVPDQMTGSENLPRSNVGSIPIPKK